MVLVLAGLDTRGIRLGYGGGFYDRFLKNSPKLHSICPIFSEQLVEEVLAYDHDIPVDGYCDCKGVKKVI